MYSRFVTITNVKQFFDKVGDKWFLGNYLIVIFQKEYEILLIGFLQNRDIVLLLANFILNSS